MAGLRGASPALAKPQLSILPCFSGYNNPSLSDVAICVSPEKRAAAASVCPLAGCERGEAAAARQAGQGALLAGSWRLASEQGAPAASDSACSGR